MGVTTYVQVSDIIIPSPNQIFEKVKSRISLSSFFLPFCHGRYTRHMAIPLIYL